jgi:preprotein translocase subunit SecE
MVVLRFVKFVDEVKQEVSKVTWSTRKEALISATMVLVVVTITSVFFLLADTIILKLIQLVLGL